MNNASLLLYFADISRGIQGMSLFLSIVFFLAMVMSIIVYFAAGTEDWVYVYKVNGKRVDEDVYRVERNKPEGYKNCDYNQIRVYSRYFPRVWMLSIVAGLLFFIFAAMAIAIPERNTILAIAASEFTEDFLSSPASEELKGLTNDTLELLRKTIKDQIGVVE